MPLLLAYAKFKVIRRRCGENVKGTTFNCLSRIKLIARPAEFYTVIFASVRPSLVKMLIALEPHGIFGSYFAYVSMSTLSNQWHV